MADFKLLNVPFQALFVLASLSTGQPTHSYHWRNLGSAQSRTQRQLNSASSLLKTESEETFKLVTELAELGAKHVVTAVAQMPNIDPKKKAQFESIGLTEVTAEETDRLNSLLRELGQLGAEASTSLAENAEGLARRAGLSRRKAEQIAKFSKLVPLLSGLVELGGETSSSKKSDSGLEILESIGLDLETGHYHYQID